MLTRNKEDVNEKFIKESRIKGGRLYKKRREQEKGTEGPVREVGKKRKQ